MTTNGTPLKRQYPYKSLLKCEVSIGAAYILDGETSPLEPELFTAIWDTGANVTCISSRLVEKMALKYLSFDEVNVLGNVQPYPKYMVHIELGPCNHSMNIEVFEVDIPEQYDVILGLDFISTGNFSLEHIFRPKFSRHLTFAKH